MKVKLSFGHNAVILSLSTLNIESKTYFTKVVYFGMLFENTSWKVKIKLSFAHKAVILSLSTLIIKSDRLSVIESITDDNVSA